MRDAKTIVRILGPGLGHDRIDVMLSFDTRVPTNGETVIVNGKPFKVTDVSWFIDTFTGITSRLEHVVVYVDHMALP